MRRILILVTSLALAFACASSSAPVTRYLLRGDVPVSSGRSDAPVKVGLRRLSVPPYLSASQGIVIETGPGEVHAARQHQWAEPVEAGLRIFLGAEIGAALGYPLTNSDLGRPALEYRIDVAIDRLHGTMEGTALLEARYRVSSASNPEAGGEFYFVRSKPLPQAGYPGVVRAETNLLKDLAASIASSVQLVTGR